MRTWSRSITRSTAPFVTPSKLRSRALSLTGSRIWCGISRRSDSPNTSGPTPPTCGCQVRCPACQPAQPLFRLVTQASGSLSEWMKPNNFSGTSLQECHSLSYAASPTLPVVAKTAIAARWFKNGEFAHHSHQMLTCESCHSKAKTSSATSDVLLPGILGLPGMPHARQAGRRRIPLLRMPPISRLEQREAGGRQI